MPNNFSPSVFLNITEFIGHFHPVLVHLPIGILLFAVGLQWLSGIKKYRSLRPAVSIAYFLGFTGAVLSSITGLSLADDGGYDEGTLALHKWMGISVAVLSLAGYFISKKQTGNIVKTITALVIFVLLNITGHLGGTLTHGEGYLTNAWNKSSSDTVAVTKKIIANVQEAKAYEDVVAPILQTKCYNCHNATKQKGGLRLDGKEWLLKGGKDGIVLAAGKPDESELYKRLLLDPLEEKHMPPKGKPQLNEKEIMLLHWWIASGASFDQPVKQLAQNPKERVALASLQNDQKSEKKAILIIPAEPVEPASPTALSALRDAGVTILPVAENNNYLSANFISVKKVDDKTVALLEAVKKQLVWLKISGAELSETSLKTVAACPNLINLSLDRTNINDNWIGIIEKMKKLQYLNLVGTQITEKGVAQLKSLPSLKHVYLYQTRVNKTEWRILQQLMPATMLDSGGYHVPALITDTVVVKARPLKQ
jgi:uncharacterized membrane protein/mono/diheme cytochrome c family protein